MKINIKKLKDCKRIVEVKLVPEKVKDAFEEVYESIGKVAHVPGYRVGKIPRDLLELHYGKTAREEVIKKLIPETYRKVLEQYKLDPVSYPDISDVKLDLKDGFSYKAQIETRPEFSLKNYKGLKLKKKKIEVKDADVQKNLETLREAATNRVQKNDGAEKEKLLPKLDDEFAKDLGFETMEKLKEAIQQNLKYRLEADADLELEMQAINQLVDSVSFDPPGSFVKKEKERLVKDANARIAYMEAIQKKEKTDKGFSLDDKDKRELERNAEGQAIRQVKAFFILDKIAEIEKIYVKEEELEKHIDATAKQYKKTKEDVRKYLEKNDMLAETALNIRNKKVVGFLLKEAKII